ncbi:hypothetical protein COCNU_05G009230 [Cocos nucifera]|uniref:Uncharacterized protein n=1 Tax=Cocos nucifera TaxID=13894 RepID=A0A8K0I9N3_COCNU|nr:hypothetical protein COCNU_05G009230 [Cocos nucifera]
MNCKAPVKAERCCSSGGLGMDRRDLRLYTGTVATGEGGDLRLNGDRDNRRGIDGSSGGGGVFREAVVVGPRSSDNLGDADVVAVPTGFGAEPQWSPQWI